MDKNSTQQEVILLTGTRFASRQYSERDAAGSTGNIPVNEKLKDACWNGLLKDMLPEIFMADDHQAKLFLWQVREANSFFALEMSEYPIGVVKYFSIDPYRFMEVQQYN